MAESKIIVNDALNETLGKDILFSQSFAHGSAQITVPLASARYITFISCKGYVIKAICTVPTAALLLDRWENNTGTFQINMYSGARNYVTCQMSGTNLLISDFTCDNTDYADQVYIVTTK